MIAIRQPWEIERIRASGRIIGLLWKVMAPLMVEGVSTAELDRAAEDFIRRQGGRPVFKGYQGYPASICVSINQEVVHGIPNSKRRLQNGDLVGLDVGVILEGYIADAARTFHIGPAPAPEALRLAATTRQALNRAIEAARAGHRLNDVSRAIQTTAESAGYSVVRQLCGHGVGQQLHEPPEIPNFVKPGVSPLLKPGMVLAIEPMVNAGGWEVEFLSDGWTVVTADGSLSAHFEDTVVVTEAEPLVVTGEETV